MAQADPDSPRTGPNESEVPGGETEGWSVADRLRGYLELVRVPNLFTAAADVLAGYITVASLLGAFDVETLVWLLISTVCLYGGGVVLNDYFDEAIDRLERPSRPLPSGRVSRLAARRLAVGLFVFAALAAAQVGPWSLGLALAIALAAAVYDAIGKRTAFGPLNMGLCRFLNLLLGVSAAPGLLLDRLTLALVLMVHVTGVTVLSRDEVSGGRSSGALVMLAALGTVGATMVALGLAGLLPDQVYLLFLSAFLMLVGYRAARAYAEPSGPNIGLAVKWGVLGIVLLDATIAAAYGGAWAGVAVAALLIPSTLLARLIPVT